MLSPKGAFVIADLMKPANELVQNISAKEWDLATQCRSLQIERNLSGFEAFAKLEWNYYSDPNAPFDPIDKPSTLFNQLKWLEKVGFTHIDLPWSQAGHAIIVGYKS